MKVIIILFMFLFHVRAIASAQSVSINVKNVSVRDVFKELRKQTGFGFLYRESDLKNTNLVTLFSKNEPLELVLEKCLKDQPLEFRIEKKLVLIKMKESASFNQNIMIRGKITDETNQPIPGASIKVKNREQAVVSNGAGLYTIVVPDKNAIIVVSYLGFETQELVVGVNKTINVVLKKSQTRLDEVLIVGYGTTTRKDLTGSVGQVDIIDLQKAPVASFADALAGRISGVSVSSADGQPGQMPDIVIRGNNSITQDNSPLYVVDGFPIEGFDASSINPQDIESIQVLKDASSSAIYGARGSNGVIIITTKSGKAGAPVVSYNGYYGLLQNKRTIDVMDPYEYVRLQIERTPSQADKYLVNGKILDDYKSDQGYNWQDFLFQTAKTHQQNISLRGGEKGLNYTVSGSLFEQEGTVVNSGFDRNQLRFSLVQRFNSRLRVSVNANYSASKQYGTFVSSTEGSRPDQAYYLLYSAWAYRPLAIEGSALEDLLFDPEISAANDSRVNPVIQSLNQLNQTRSNNLIANGFLEYELIKGLAIKVSGGYNMIGNRNELFNNSLTRTGNPLSAQYIGINGRIRESTLNSWVNENTLTYRKKYNKVHSFNFLLGFTQQSRVVKSEGIEGKYLPNESIGLNGINQGTISPLQPTDSKWGLMSYLSRVNYDFKSKYLFTASFRADGSSKFDKPNRWSYFPSVALAWRISDEKFMKNLTFFDDVKFRGSYGITGNNRVSDFPGRSTISFLQSRTYSFNNQYAIGSSPGSMGNPDLKWESTKSTDIGLDITTFNKRVTFTADYYNKNTVDLLLNALLPYTLGYERAFKNIGKVNNSGLEFSVHTENINKGKLKWSSDFNIAFNRNKVLGLTTNQETLTSTVGWHYNYNTSPLYIAKIGQPIGMLYGAIWDGVYTYDDFNRLPNGKYELKGTLPNNGITSTSIQPGDIKYRDINGDGTINNDDYTIIGNPNPKFIGGFNNNLKYKSFDLNIFFQYNYGNDIFNANRLVFENGSILGVNQYASFANRWSPDNPNSDLFRVFGQGPNYYSSRVVEDGSFIRLKTVHLGYTVPKEILNRVKVKSLQVYLSAQNLYTWTNYSGMDPEVSTKNSALTPGFDYSSYPRARTITFGINASF